MSKIKRIEKLIQSNAILISASLIFVVGIAISIYLNVPQVKPTLIGDIIAVLLLTSAYIIIGEIVADFILKLKPSGAT